MRSGGSREVSSPEEQAAAWRAAQASAAAYAQPAYAQPPGPYPQAPYPPQYYPPPYYAQAPGYYMPVYSQPPSDSSTALVAGIMWLLCIVRDTVFLIGFLLIGSALPFFFPFGFGGALFVFALFPVLGIVGSAIAMACDFQRKNHNLGSLGAVLGLVGSSFPGLLVFGPVGIVLSVLGLALHLVAKKDFRVR